MLGIEQIRHQLIVRHVGQHQIGAGHRNENSLLKPVDQLIDRSGGVRSA